ncbi:MULTISPECIES: TIGR00730 family Rossman fold protein [Acinetobacter]|uniref:Cytokinin riboside 5'-monophosphate phosphoribohydrolase n=1 Tax=Acinetobacter variabilis TaxID=70346 RepID=N9MR20_9GAMM|nr:MULTISPECIES: TIGR00730 family Rossman fold protein [Acinetobacter]AUX91010.1 TIGR00730 family Rossman fold protein [Acinetobacter sp. ACNIH1]ENX11003.1 TIGR00730 family protein [Acinetobacter variabilis]MCU4364275.1 TIGR00730 family Rossman fold protein [Acinetobacter variabilis]MCU4374390.1 TIGR00730 family Rossman fold protein [Acinetobacter variabilis]QKW81527.1 TIGR00730 family Rossman fold protein [Acinetobacter sp. FDAARGOS_724]
MKSIAVFCGSAMGNSKNFKEQAQALGESIANRGITLVYGGGRAGLMGVVADSALNAGGTVIGVIPQNLVDAELAHPLLTELHVVKNMHERKTKMSDLADAFIALPGGVGTLEEIFEQLTWGQLGLHQKPCAFLNIHGFYDELLNFLMKTTEAGFTQSRFTDALIFSSSIEEVLDAVEHYHAPEPKWNKSVKAVESV